MVAAKTLVIAAAALAFLIPERVGAAGQAAGTFAGGLASGITSLGTIRIAPEFAPNISPRVVPEIGIKTDFPDWLDPKDIWAGFTSVAPRIVTGTTTTVGGVVVDPEETEVVEVVVPPEPIEKEIERKFVDPESDEHGN